MLPNTAIELCLIMIFEKKSVCSSAYRVAFVFLFKDVYAVFVFFLNH